MTIELKIFVRDDFARSPEFRRVDEIARSLLTDLEQPEIAEAMVCANQPGKSSSEIQNCLIASATQLGFTSERRGLFVKYQSSLRPDYFLQLDGTGIILEVERGQDYCQQYGHVGFLEVSRVSFGPLSFSVCAKGATT